MRESVPLPLGRTWPCEDGASAAAAEEEEPNEVDLWLFGMLSIAGLWSVWYLVQGFVE